MAYSDFTLQEVAQRFQLVIEEQHNLFGAVPEVIPGDFLCALLDQYFGQNLGCLISNDAIVTKRFVIRAGFFQTLPVG
jgi:hypothetical protein